MKAIPAVVGISLLVAPLALAKPNTSPSAVSTAKPTGTFQGTSSTHQSPAPLSPVTGSFQGSYFEHRPRAASTTVRTSFEGLFSGE
jgi:hypothetical protein